MDVWNSLYINTKVLMIVICNGKVLMIVICNGKIKGGTRIQGYGLSQANKGGGGGERVPLAVTSEVRKLPTV